MIEVLRRRLDGWMATLGQQGYRAYLVLDATWHPELTSHVRASEHGWEPLMGSYGERRSDAHARSPLIVDLALHATVIDQWLAEAFLDKLGIVVFSALEIEAMRSSLKRFTTVLTPEFEKPAYFRFYDARTLHCFLKTGFAEQWRDFFRDIALIAAPTDLTEGWVVFTPENDGLRLGIDGEDGRVQWQDIPEFAKSEQAYGADFPFRRIQALQFDAIMACTRMGFHREIYDFLVRAFPEEARSVERKVALAEIAKAHDTADREGYDSEDCVFYWAVLTFMEDEEFYKTPMARQVLPIQYWSKESRLEYLIDYLNQDLANPHLRKLTDVWTVKISNKQEVDA